MMKARVLELNASDERGIQVCSIISIITIELPVDTTQLILSWFVMKVKQYHIFNRIVSFVGYAVSVEFTSF